MLEPGLLEPGLLEPDLLEPDLLETLGRSPFNAEWLITQCSTCDAPANGVCQIRVDSAGEAPRRARECVSIKGERGPITGPAGTRPSPSSISPEPAPRGGYEEKNMASKQAVVGSAIGLHARPAAIIADKAGEYDDDILLSKVGSTEEPVDAASPLMIMTLGAKKGDTVNIESDDATAVDELATLIASDLDKE